METARAAHTVTLLANGWVLLVGGWILISINCLLRNCSTLLPALLVQQLI
jgi:hypothetical protein